MLQGCCGSATHVPLLKRAVVLVKVFTKVPYLRQRTFGLGGVLVWRKLENVGVEAVVRLGKWLAAAEMFWDDAGTCARGAKGLN